MKKLLSFLLVLAMCVSLSACGGNDPEPADSGNKEASETVSQAAGGSANDGSDTDEQISVLKEAYNQVATLYNEVATNAEANGWMADEQTIGSIQTIGAVLEPVGLALEGDMSSLEGADLDTLPDTLLEFVPALEQLAEKVSAPYEGGSDAAGTGVVTDEALKPLAEIYNQIAPVYNEIYENAEANGWMEDEQTALELNGLNGMLSEIAYGLTEDPSKLEGVDIDALIEQLEQINAAFPELSERVSVPYEG